MKNKWYHRVINDINHPAAIKEEASRDTRTGAKPSGEAEASEGMAKIHHEDERQWADRHHYEDEQQWTLQLPALKKTKRVETLAV